VTSLKKTILVVEDENDLAESLKYNLERQGGYDVTIAPTGEQGLALARGRPFDLILLDVMLPGMDGYEVCRALRATPAQHDIPIIMLTARVEESDKLVGLEIGADDYMTKPFSMKEVLARVKAHLRRASRPTAEGSAVYHGATLEMDFEGHLLRAGGREIALTRMEFALLAALIKSHGRVLSREHLLEKIWGYQYFGGMRTVDVHVRRLRKKLGEPGNQIETVFGVGYRFREDGGPAGKD